MEIGKVIKLRNWNLIRWNRKHDIGFTTTLFSFYRIMKITRWLKYNRKLSRRKKEKKTEKLEILALKCLIKSGRVKCEKTYLKDYSTWCHTWTLCKIISYDFKIDDMIGIFINTDLNVQHCNKCLNVTVQGNILCKKCGQMNVLIRNKNVLYPWL